MLHKNKICGIIIKNRGGTLNRKQVLRLLKVGIVATIIMLAFEMIFSIDAVNDWFFNLIVNAGAWAYIVIWILMFLQVTVLNIPAYVILMACFKIGIPTLDILYISVVLSAYMAGCILAYSIGRKWGKKAVKWCAGSDAEYNKWSEVLNKKGKWWYFGTILFPMFPDDLLCIVAGAVKFKFWWYVIMNLVGRGIGLTTMLVVFQAMDIFKGSLLMLWIWAGALIIEWISLFIVKSDIKRGRV